MQVSFTWLKIAGEVYCAECGWGGALDPHEIGYKFSAIEACWATVDRLVDELKQPLRSASAGA
jgi:hypothetical protein